MAGLHFSDNLQDTLLRPYIFIDNDVLKALQNSPEFVTDLTTILNSRKLFLHPLTEFEFLRDTHLLEFKLVKERLLSNQLFKKIGSETNLKLLPKLTENALLLSNIYTFKEYKGSSSYVDLILGGLLMYLNEKGALITGNPRDFPRCVFDVLSVINMEESDGHVKPLCIVGFNKEKFDKCSSELKNLDLRETIKMLEKINAPAKSR